MPSCLASMQSHFSFQELKLLTREYKRGTKCQSNQWKFLEIDIVDISGALQLRYYSLKKKFFFYSSLSQRFKHVAVTFTSSITAAPQNTVSQLGKQSVYWKLYSHSMGNVLECFNSAFTLPSTMSDVLFSLLQGKKGEALLIAQCKSYIGNLKTPLSSKVIFFHSQKL